MFMMKKGTVAVALIVVAGLLLSDIQLAQGLKCWSCPTDCTKEEPTELQCTEDEPKYSFYSDPEFLKQDRCFKETHSTGRIVKGCISQQDEFFNFKSLKCDFVEPTDVQICFCKEDLCNPEPLYSKRQRLVTERKHVKFLMFELTRCSKGQLILSSVASVAACFIINLLL